MQKAVIPVKRELYGGDTMATSNPGSRTESDKAVTRTQQNVNLTTAHKRECSLESKDSYEEMPDPR